MDARTGKPLAGDAHLVQSIGDILATPIGTFGTLRDYGAALFDLVDAPLNRLTRLRAFAASAVALGRWEPRLRITRLALDGDATGRGLLSVEGYRTDAPAPNDLVRLSIPLALR